MPGMDDLNTASRLDVSTDSSAASPCEPASQLGMFASGFYHTYTAAVFRVGHPLGAEPRATLDWCSATTFGAQFNKGALG